MSWNRHKGVKSDDRPNQQSLLILVRNGLKEHTTIYYLQQKSEIFGPLKLLYYTLVEMKCGKTKKKSITPPTLDQGQKVSRKENTTQRKENNYKKTRTSPPYSHVLTNFVFPHLRYISAHVRRSLNKKSSLAALLLTFCSLSIVSA